MSEVKSGVETTEHKEAQSAKLWGVISMILGFIMASGSEILVALGVTADSKFGIIAGVVIMVAGQISKALVSLGYIKSRADVKVAAENANAKATE